MAETKKCKYCQSEIDKKAKVCPVCKRSLKGHGCLVAVVAATGHYERLYAAVPLGFPWKCFCDDCPAYKRPKKLKRQLLEKSGSQLSNHPPVSMQTQLRWPQTELLKIKQEKFPATSITNTIGSPLSLSLTTIFHALFCQWHTKNCL